MASFACRINSSMLCPCAVAVAPACPAMPPPVPEDPGPGASQAITRHARSRRAGAPAPAGERADPEPRLVLEPRGAHADRPLVDEILHLAERVRVALADPRVEVARPLLGALNPEGDFGIDRK